MEIIRVGLINSMGMTDGCEKAPVEILKELKDIGSNEKREAIEFEKLRLEEIHLDPANLEEASYLIFKNSKEAFEKNFKTFFIGGDHSVSYPIVRAFKETEQNPFLIVFDAHADCCNPGKEPTHEEWLRAVIETGFNSDRIVLISARNFYKEEIEFLKENKILCIGMDLVQEDLQGVCDLIMERALSSSGFYISIDIDSVDPGFAPGTGYPEAGGLSSRELIYFIKRLKLLKNFRGADIVEINPLRDLNKATVRLGAKLLSEMI